MAAACSFFSSSAGTLSLSQPRSTATPRSGRFGTTNTFGRCLIMRDELVVDVPVAHAVSKRIDPGAQQSLRILEREDVSRDAELVLVGLVDDRAVQRPDVSFLYLPSRSSTQILTKSTFLAASSCTAFRASASVVTQYGASVRPGSGIVIPRPAVRSRAASGIVSSRTWNATSPVSWPRLMTDADPVVRLPLQLSRRARRA